MVLSRDKFGKDLFVKVGEAVKLLLDAGYEVFVRYDEPGLGIVVIEYCYDDRIENYGSGGFMYLDIDEQDMIYNNRAIKEMEENGA